MEEMEFMPVPGHYPLTVSRDGVFRNEVTGKILKPTKTRDKAGRIKWIISFWRDGNLKTSISVQRAWALCYMPVANAHTLRVALRDNPVELKDAIDPTNVVWLRSYNNREVNVVLGDGTEVMAVSKAALAINLSKTKLQVQLKTKGFSDTGTLPARLREKS